MATIRQNRNAPCRCGSGIKAKKCCLLASRANDYARRDYAKSDIAKATNEIVAAVGGIVSFVQPDEPAIGPPRWAAWSLLGAMALGFFGVIFVLIFQT